jgi:hypothetical protein
MPPVVATLVVGLLIVAVNVPFGAWRATLRTRSAAWFVAVHVPVVMAMATRWVLDIPFRWGAVPVYVAAFVAGQWIGIRIGRRKAQARVEAEGVV